MPYRPNAFDTIVRMYQSVASTAIVFPVGAFLVKPKYMSYEVWDENTEKIIVLGILIFSASSMLFGLSFYKKRIAELRSSEKPVKARMNRYIRTCGVFWGLLFLSATMSAISIMITGNNLLVGVSGMLVIIILLFAPKKEKTIEILHLDDSEVAYLEGKD